MYQIKAIEKVEEATFSGKSTEFLSMVTGTGKIRIILGMIYRFLKAKCFNRILFLIDRTSLGDQAIEVFEEVKLEELLTLDENLNIKNERKKKLIWKQKYTFLQYRAWFVVLSTTKATKYLLFLTMT